MEGLVYLPDRKLVDLNIFFILAEVKEGPDLISRTILLVSPWLEMINLTSPKTWLLGDLGDDKLGHKHLPGDLNIHVPLLHLPNDPGHLKRAQVCHLKKSHKTIQT